MAVTEEQVTELYVATFNRAPDAGGLNHWANASGLTIEGIAKEFFKAPETQRKYPEGTTDEEFVNTIYQNVFGRDAEQTGIDYWADVLGKGWSTRDEMIMTVMGGAQNKDQQVLLHKTEVGMYYADQVGGNHVDGYKFSLADITDNAATVADAKSAVDELVSIENVTIDIGTLESAAVIDAGNGVFNFTDDASVFSNVVINNFSADDAISFAHAAVNDYSFSNDGSNVTLSYNYNDEGIMNIIQLAGVVSNDALVSDLSSFTATIGFDPFTGTE